MGESGVGGELDIVEGSLGVRAGAPGEGHGVGKDLLEGRGAGVDDHLGEIPGLRFRQGSSSGGLACRRLTQASGKLRASS